jgi:hypothetical protein
MIDKINQRYENLGSRKVECYLIGHDCLFSFFQEKSSLDPHLKEAGESDRYANSLRVRLNYLAFEYANCPLPLNAPYFYREGRMEKIKASAEKIVEDYPTWSEKLQNILNAVEILRSCEDNPLLEKIEQSIGFEDTTLILINPDYTHALMEMADSYGIQIKVNAANTPLDAESTKGVFCGCAKYFPQHSFWAPVHKELHLARYTWFPDYLKDSQEVLGTLVPVTAPELVVKEKAPVPQKETMEEIELDDPAADFNTELFERYKGGYSGEGHFEDVESKIVILRGGKFVFLPADDNYRHHCLVNLDKDPTVKKVTTSDFDENTAILLRERESEDYVVEVANMFMRDKAEAYRKQQRRWKEALRSTIDAFGTSAVSNFLKKEGCSTATYQNLRNWASQRSIRPKKDEDFICLLNYLDLDNEAPEIMGIMDIINRSHIKAGHWISRKLRDLVKNDKNLKSIFADGYRIYKGDTGGKLGVYMFKRALDSTLSIPYTEVGKLKNIEELHG